MMLAYVIGLLVIGAVWFFHFQSARKAAGSAAWPTAEGLVRASSVRENLETDAEGDSERAFYPNVQYAWSGSAPNFIRNVAANARYRRTSSPWRPSSS